MSNSKALGKGLAALIGGPAAAAGEPAAAEGARTANESEGLYQELPIGQLRGNPDQPRTVFDETALQELADSLKAVGVVQPVVVRHQGDHYQIIAGERRWRAAKLAGLKTLPAIIRQADDAESLELALIENISREDLNPIDTARAYACLQEDFGSTQEELAGRLGRSRSAIANTLRLLELPDEVQNLLEEGKLTEGHGRALLSLADRSRQRQMAARVVARGLSVRQTEELVKKEKNPPKARLPRVAPMGQELMDEATDALYSAFRLPVKVHWTGGGGRIEIGFRDDEQLMRVIETLDRS